MQQTDGVVLKYAKRLEKRGCGASMGPHRALASATLVISFPSQAVKPQLFRLRIECGCARSISLSHRIGCQLRCTYATKSQALDVLGAVLLAPMSRGGSTP